MTILSGTEIISALILLLPASGISLEGHDQITSETIEAFSPPPDAYISVSEFFKSMDFEVGPLVGLSFSITAPSSAFKSLFKTELVKSPEGGIQSREGGPEIEPDSLPSNIRRLIQTITFDEPPDFGPKEFSE